MSFRALLFTAAAIAFFVSMVMRPVVDLSDTSVSEKIGGLTITGVEQTFNQNAEPTNNSSDSATTQVEQLSSSTTATTQTETSNHSAALLAANSKPDYAREKRIRNEISDAILEGDVLFLHDDTRNFMAIQTTADNARGGAVILHGRGFHPDWEDTVYPLRTGLVEEGWTTLSLQMPVLEKQAKYYDYMPLFPEAGKRISAGIQHLKDQGVSPIVLIAHSCGGHMAMQWVRDNGDDDIAAFAGLGMGATDFEQHMSEPFPLNKMQVPILDAYGENDFPAVIKMAPERWELVKAAGNQQSAQHVVPEADHYFKNQGDALVGLIATWLNGLRF